MTDEIKPTLCECGHPVFAHDDDSGCRADGSPQCECRLNPERAMALLDYAKAARLPGATQ